MKTEDILCSQSACVCLFYAGESLPVTAVARDFSEGDGAFAARLWDDASALNEACAREHTLCCIGLSVRIPGRLIDAFVP